MKRTAHKISAVLFVLFAALPANAGPTCEISEDKKRTILALLCGQMAREREHHFEGPNCITNSVRVRFRDTAIQILGLKMCGDLFNRKGLKLHVLERRATENYFTDVAVKQTFGASFRALAPFEMSDANPHWGKKAKTGNWRLRQQRQFTTRTSADF